MELHERDLRRRRLYIGGGLILLLAVVVIIFRLHAAHALREKTDNGSVVTVTIAQPKKSAPSEELILPGNVQAWHEAPVFARTNGYLKNWYVDIGGRVKAGQVLAEIETPEIDAELRQAEADLKTAEANSALAQSTAKRWQALLATDSVSKQEADEKISDAAAKTSGLAAARANRDRLREMESFKRVVAPFAGTVTARNTDIGALINAGGAAGQELFHIADTGRLRVYVQVPQNYVEAIRPGMVIQLHFAEHSGKTYAAKLLQTANALDPASRTLLAQFETDNLKSELLAGGYTEAHLKVPTRDTTMHLPVNALIFRTAGLQVATVADADKIKMKNITMGRDYGDEVEIRAGIGPDDRVVLNPPDSLFEGQQVRIKAPEKKKADNGKSEEKK